VPGSPIRTPPDQRSVDSSPGPIAASHVLHRLLVPRHPPCALTHLHTAHTTARQPPQGLPQPSGCTRTHAAHGRAASRHHSTTTQKPDTQKIKMLASAIQFSNTPRKPHTPHQPPTRNPTPTREAGPGRFGRGCEPVMRDTTRPPPRHTAEVGAGPVPSGPNSAPPRAHDHAGPGHTARTRAHPKTRDVYDVSTHEHTPGGTNGHTRVILNPHTRPAPAHPEGIAGTPPARGGRDTGRPPPQHGSGGRGLEGSLERR
jgi:hypothetical protein